MDITESKPATSTLNTPATKLDKNVSANGPETPASQSGNSSQSDSQSLDQIRNLLLSADRESTDDAIRRLDAIESRLNSPVERAKDIDEVIVSVLRQNLATEQDLRQVLQPLLMEHFQITAKEQPDVMAEALFPILGPAIRKMIGSLISPDKKSRKRKYRLEQLLLIDKETGLPLCQVASDAVISQDADMVSGMLSAIQSFVHDAFSADEFDGLNTLQVGELSVWIEWGPSAVLAAVVRGAPPQSLREAMQIYLEQIHVDHGESLSSYDGDASKFEHLKPELVSLLDNHDGSLKNQYRNFSSYVKRWFVGGVVALLCLVAWYLYSANDAEKWEGYVASLKTIPGVVVIGHERQFRNYTVTGLKDPSVNIPAVLLTNASINPEFVAHQFEAYQALHPEIILNRVRSIAELPKGTSLSLEGSVLSVVGNVDYSWLQAFRQQLSNVAGIERVVFSGKQ